MCCRRMSTSASSNSSPEPPKARSRTSPGREAFARFGKSLTLDGDERNVPGDALVRPAREGGAASLWANRRPLIDCPHRRDRDQTPSSLCAGDVPVRGGREWRTGGAI